MSIKRKIRIIVLETNLSNKIVSSCMLSVSPIKGEIMPINKYQYSLLKRNNVKFSIV